MCLGSRASAIVSATGQRRIVILLDRSPLGEKILPFRVSHELLDAMAPVMPVGARGGTAYHRVISHESPLDPDGFLGCANLDNYPFSLIPNALECQGQIRRV
jgi:hypothetical protein